MGAECCSRNLGPPIEIFVRDCDSELAKVISSGRKIRPELISHILVGYCLQRGLDVGIRPSIGRHPGGVIILKIMISDIGKSVRQDCAKILVPGASTLAFSLLSKC